MLPPIAPADPIQSRLEGSLYCESRTMETEYMPGDVVPITSALYRVVHDPLEAGEHLDTFHAGDLFPFCSERGRKVRYVLPSRLLRKKISN